MRMIFFFLATLLLFPISKDVLIAQSSKNRAILDTGTVEAQLEYVIDDANVYNEYKVIKIPYIQKLKKNIRDSLHAVHKENAQYKAAVSEKNKTIDTLQAQLQKTKTELTEAIRTKNSLSILGIQLDKTYYNSMMWIIILALGGLLGFGVVLYKRNNSITVKTKNELNELKSIHDEYRNKARMDKEQMVVKHYDEVKKLKEQLMKQKSGPSKY